MILIVGVMEVRLLPFSLKIIQDRDRTMVMEELKLWELIKPIFFYDEKGEPYYTYIKTVTSVSGKAYYHLRQG
jgi:hypothetical protein